MPDKENPRVLIIEDDPGQARLVQKHLERKGYVIEVAADGNEGLTMLDRIGYDAILLDYNLPQRNGMDVLAALTRVRSAPPVIMVTGNGNEKVAVDAMKAGASDYIVKDPDMEYLELLPMVIDQVIQQERLVRDRSRMRKEAKESEERYRKLVELFPDGIAINADGRFAFINPAGKAILGAREDDDLLGRPVLDFVHPDFRPMMEERLAALASDRADLSFVEEKFVRLDGREVDVEVTVRPLMFRGEAVSELIFRDVTEQNRARQRLEYMGKFDLLTALPNRALFFDRLNRLLDNGARYEQMLALLFLDLDHFKDVNDAYGHDAGDQLLQQVAVRLTGCVREADSVARLGGDEFAVILSRIAAPSDAEVVARKILNAMAAPFPIGIHLCSVGASIGISVAAGAAIEANSLIQQADAAMYCAKQAGGNAFRYSAAGLP